MDSSEQAAEQYPQDAAVARLAVVVMRLVLSVCRPMDSIRLAKALCRRSGSCSGPRLGPCSVSANRSPGAVWQDVSALG